MSATLYRNARVLTLAGPPADALLVRDGRVVAGGTADDLRPGSALLKNPADSVFLGYTDNQGIQDQGAPVDRAGGLRRLPG